MCLIRRQRMCDAFDKESFCFVREKKSEEITRVVGK